MKHSEGSRGGTVSDDAVNSIPNAEHRLCFHAHAAAERRYRDFNDSIEPISVSVYVSVSLSVRIRQSALGAN